MNIKDVVKQRLPSILIAIAAALAVVGIEVSEAEVNATVEAALGVVAGVSTLYAAVRVWIDKFRGPPAE